MSAATTENPTPVDTQPMKLRWWLLGVPAALLIAWAAGMWFCDSTTVVVWNDDLQEWTFDPAFVRHHRTEGWGSTVFGPHGEIGPLRFTDHPDPDRYVLWGDSYIEAYHVGDAQKMQNLINRDWAVAHPDDPLNVTAMGSSGWRLSDYVRLVPRYEALTGVPAGHLIVLQSFQDLTVDPTLAEPLPVEQYRRKTAPSFQSWRRFLREWRLSGLRAFVHELKWMRIRWTPGPAEEPVFAYVPPPFHDTQETWDYLAMCLDRLAADPEAPCTVVWMPDTPAVTDQGIQLEPEGRAVWERLAQMARERGLGFVSLEPTLREHHERTGGFAYGFANTFPGRGHLNADGHRLVADVLIDTLEASRHDLHAD